MLLVHVRAGQQHKLPISSWLLPPTATRSYLTTVSASFFFFGDVAFSEYSGGPDFMLNSTYGESGTKSRLHEIRFIAIGLPWLIEID